MKTMADNILFTASLLTALTVIIATAMKVYKFIRKCEKWIFIFLKNNLKVIL